MAVLEGLTLAVVMVGMTHYVDIGQGTDAVIYYESETEAHMTLPNGVTWEGTMVLKADGYFVDWADGPEGDWQLGHVPGQITYIDGKGEVIGMITRLVPGNPEGF
ncbi:MAG: hypothetical protein AAFY59_02890 [Pseudomonadota bacterium]